MSNFNDRAWTTILTELNLKFKDGVEITTYNCRDTFITLQVMAGRSDTEVGKWVGNKSQVVQKHYLEESELGYIAPEEI